jgi:hypothetical protein
VNLFYVDDIGKSESGKMATNTPLAVKWVEYDNVAVRFAKSRGYG